MLFLSHTVATKERDSDKIEHIYRNERRFGTSNIVRGVLWSVVS